MLSEDSDNESIHQLTINEHFAKAFEYRKEREELQKLKDKYGSDVDEGEEDEEDSEDAESEDEDGEELTPAVDAAILRTLARIKRKDPEIYEQGKDVFEEEIKKTGKHKLSKRADKDKSKPLTFRQHALASALNPTSRSPSPEPLTHIEEQKALRNETITAFHTAVDVEDDEDDLLVPREKTKDELERQDEEYRDFLQREVGEDLSTLITIEDNGVLDEPTQREEEEPKEKKKKRDKKAKGGKNTEGDQEFLMNYILNRGWIDKSAKRHPTYHEVTGMNRKGKARADSDNEGDEQPSERDADSEDNEGLDEDEFDEVADRFESSYNFRFEEPGADAIARYPRNLNSLVRREDSSRKEAREKRKARKEEEMLKKKEEIKRLKSLKMKEIREKLERVGREGGKTLAETAALQELDLEGDWDPDAHDKQMTDIYGQDSEDAFNNDEKPQWDDDIDVTDIVHEEAESSEKKKKKKKKKKGGDEEGVDESGVNVDEMDADVEMAVDEEEWDGTEEMRKRKLDEYMDEIYGLDFNDMVGGMPTRFKYTKVQQQAYALSPVEILLATDAELNQYMGIKKYAPYRKDGNNWDQNRSTRLKELKTKLQERGVTSGVAGEASAGERPAKKRKGKKERMKAKEAVVQDGDEEGEDMGGGAAMEADRSRDESKSEETKRNRHQEPVEEEVGAGGGVEGTTKKRRRHKKSGVSSQL